MKYRYGIISTASIVPRFIQAVQDYGDEVVAIASRTLTKAQEAAAEYNICKAYGCYMDLYEDPDVDIVYIATPNDTHASEALHALQQKKHVIIEKPFALTTQEALQVFQFAMEQHCFVMEAQKSVFLPATGKLKELLQQKVLGACQQISMLSSFPGAYSHDHWMYQSYGGVLYGSGSYTIEYLMYLFDNPKLEIQASTDAIPGGAVIDAGIHLVINDHLLADSHITMKVKTDNAATFYCDHGWIRVENYWKARKLVVHPDHGEEEQLLFPVEHEMIYEVAHIHECIEQGMNHSPVMTPERTILCVEMVSSLQSEEEEAAENSPR